MVELIGLIFIVYLIGLAYLRRQWDNGLDNYKTSAPSKSCYSILIPFRNEGDSLIELIENILPQLGTEDEIILINDHSENGLNQQLKEQFLSNKQILLLGLGDGELGKKSALKTGFLQSKGEFIIQVDADVEVGPKWLIGIKQVPDSVDLGILPVTLTNVNHGFQRLEYSEFMSIVGVSGAMAARGKAAMANGANLLVRRNLMQKYFDHGSDKSISSGDDMFLLGLAKQLKSNIQYCFDSRIIVHAKGNQSFRDYLDQRIRWASKMLHGKNLPARGFGLLTIFFQVFFIVAMCYLIATKNWWELYLYFGTKGFSEFLFSKKVAYFFGYAEWLDNFSIPGVILYPFISLYTAFASIFYRPKWKGRIIETK